LVSESAEPGRHAISNWCSTLYTHGADPHNVSRVGVDRVAGGMVDARLAVADGNLK